MGANAQKVRVDLDKSVNFNAFKTYGWADGRVAKNPLIGHMIVSAIEDELSRRGLTKVTDSPDISIAVMAAIDIDLQGVGPTWNNTLYKTWGGYGNPAALMNVHSGNLLIDLITTTDKISVFRGVASSTLPVGPSADLTADARSVESKVNKAVKKIFAKYPVSAQS